MRKLQVSGVLLALVCCMVPLAGAQQPPVPPPPPAPPQLPAQITGQPGTFITVKAVSPAPVQWFCPDAGLTVFPPDQLKDSRTIVLMAAQPGTYRLVCWTADPMAGPSPASVCLVVVTGPQPPPGPTPPPTPPGPTPDALLLASLKAAQAQETDTNTSSYLSFLTTFYQKGAPALITDQVKTVGDLFTTMRTALHNPGAGIPAGALPHVMGTISGELNKALGTNPQAALDKAAAQAVFGKVALALANLPQKGR